VGNGKHSGRGAGGEGTTRIQFLGIGGTYRHTDPDIAEKDLAAMGFTGRPGYSVDMESGEVISQKILLTLDAQQSGVAFRIPRTELPMALPIVVRNLNPNWPVFLTDRAAKRWRPLGVTDDGTAYATLDTNAQGWEVFIGHPITASDADIVLNLAQIAEEEWRLEVHNPKDDRVGVRLELSPFFALAEISSSTIAVEPGESHVACLAER